MQRILVIATQRLGDVLLATPLMHSLRNAWPNSRIEALVFDDTASVLAANADLDRVITVARRPTLSEHLRLVRTLWRHYDLALSTGAGDRPTLYAWIAGRRCVGLALDGPKHAWKRRMLDAWAPFDDLDTHTVVMNLRLADLVHVPRAYDVSLAWTTADEVRVRGVLGAMARPFAVLHLSPKFVYKAWHAQGWIRLGQWLAAQGLRVVLTGAGDLEEIAAIDALRAHLPQDTLNVSGMLTLPQVGHLLSRARLFVGPDTVVTHAAAATGIPTIALFGPSNPVKWGPWPRDCHTDPSPFDRIGSQRVGNVYLLQGVASCVPCMQEGCDRHVKSLSACLQQLPAERVIEAARVLLHYPDPAPELPLSSLTPDPSPEGRGERRVSADADRFLGGDRG